MIEHSRNFRRIKKLWDLVISISIKDYYLIETEDGRDLGVWYFHPCEDGMMIHANMLVKGKRAAKSARNAINWIFEHTSSKVIYADIPNNKRHAQMMASVVGFELFYCGLNKSKGYRLWVDQFNRF